ncbi:DUF2852 domain-containing protein [Maritimibacter sp. HL-12]|jgi:hypothetical protein|uniref:DUF2852 domain-containing protein n=1 Tax=Maritimibacter sp. HL-12 TaxID=1162418 RepID=UPI000A0F02CA|nr:DUF2852 domain-containing protein [Maritimibacter sp. HL-12]SMH55777.1 Protein of unknown function [Maritimibacter sp. HL-12]
MHATATPAAITPRAAAPERMPVAVQILSTLIYGAFAITAVALAFVHFWPAGVALAALLGWRGGFVPQNFTQINADEIVAQVRALGPEARDRSSGNASFDAYRADTLRRLETEQQGFEAFLTRLRTARDQREFDAFMDERALTARKAHTEPDAAPDATGADDHGAKA